MYPFAVCTFLIGLLAMLHSTLIDTQKLNEEGYKNSLAINFCIYRTSVARYVEMTEHVQNVPTASLDLPPGYVFMRQWQTRIIGDYCYIYGETENDEPYLIRQKMRNSLLVGENRNGTLYPSGISIPQGIPSGTVVSIVSLP